LDSLVAIELESWWKEVFGFDISTLEMFGMGSLLALGRKYVEGLLAVANEGQATALLMIVLQHQREATVNIGR
jgi:hypothetical protein